MSEDKKMATDKEAALKKVEQALSAKQTGVEFDGEDKPTETAEPNMSNEAESERETSKAPNDKPKKQSKEENAKFAEKRRQEQAKLQEQEMLEKLKKEAFEKGVIEGIGGKNPFTGEPISDEVDLQEYQDMKTLKSQGKDPIAEYPAFLKEKQRKQKQLMEQQEVSKKKAQQFIDEFESKYPGKFKEVWDDQAFQDYADGKLNGNKSLVEVYEGFLRLVGRKAEVIADRKVSKALSSPGSMTQQDSESTPQDWKTMSKEDFKKFVERAKRGEFRK